jgi:hypothetical protein
VLKLAQKIPFLFIITIIFSGFTSCALIRGLELLSLQSDIQPKSESAKSFIQETQLSLIVPIRFYTWVKVENSDRVRPDISSGSLDFEYNGSDDFLLKTVTQDDKIISIWGNQILSQSKDYRYLIFSPFVPAVYALEKGQDPLDIAFEALNQILADESYKSYETELINVFQEGIWKYRTGGSAWANYKAEHFTVKNKTIKFK